MNRKQIKEGIKYWSQLLILPIYVLSFLVPRNKRIWLFGSTFGRRFADNPRYFYLYLCQHPEESIRPIAEVSTNNPRDAPASFLHFRAEKTRKASSNAGFRVFIGGEGGIRTHGCLATSPDFESGTFNHSATSPSGTRF